MTTPSAGARLVAELSQPDDPYSLTFLIEQAGYVADYLDKLNKLLTGHQESWVSLKVGGHSIELVVNNALMETRHQTTVLRHLLAEIHRQRAAIPMNTDDDDLAGLN